MYVIKSKANIYNQIILKNYLTDKYERDRFGFYRIYIFLLNPRGII